MVYLKPECYVIRVRIRFCVQMGACVMCVIMMFWGHREGTQHKDEQLTNCTSFWTTSSCVAGKGTWCQPAVHLNILSHALPEEKGFTPQNVFLLCYTSNTKHMVPFAKHMYPRTDYIQLLITQRVNATCSRRYTEERATSAWVTVWRAATIRPQHEETCQNVLNDSWQRTQAQSRFLSGCQEHL